MTMAITFSCQNSVGSCVRLLSIEKNSLSLSSSSDKLKLSILPTTRIILT